MNVLSTWVIHYTVGGGNAEVDETQSLSMEIHDSLRRPLNLDQSVIPEAVSRHSVTKLCRASPWARGAMRWPKPSAMPVSAWFLSVCTRGPGRVKRSLLDSPSASVTILAIPSPGCVPTAHLSRVRAL